MEGFKLHRIGMVMEPEAGNPNEVEGVLNPAAARGPDGALYLSRDWSRRGITPASALRVCASMQRAILSASTGLASPSNRKPTMSTGRAGAGVKIRASPMWSRSENTSCPTQPIP